MIAEHCKYSVFAIIGGIIKFIFRSYTVRFILTI
jgi:hypothetical protein